MMNLHSASPSARLSSDTTSSASPPPRRRLSRQNRDNANMVDASPQPGRPHPHNRSSFLSFSFNKNRTNSAQAAPAHSFLHSVREVAGRGSGGNLDEFGASRLQPQPPPSSTSTITPTSAHSGSTMTSNAPPQNERPGSSGGPPSSSMDLQPQRQLHPEIRSIVNLSQAHAHKIYFSGPLVKHVERHTDGKIVGKEEPWREVWAQLGGTTLSVWDMKAIEEASRRGTEVPPTYLNITDASIHVLGAVTMPGSDGNPVKYMNVITLTTAGLNLLLFSCPNPQGLVAWTAALRLSAYEKSRLEELYTAHLLRMSLSEHGVWKDPRSPLVNGHLEGWVKIRINGQTDWKRLWMCAQAGQTDAHPADASATRKNRMSTLFGRAGHEHSNSINSVPGPEGGGIDPRAPHIALYASQKPRDRKKPVLTLANVTQVFAVYPERPELISRSTLIKLEGFIGDEELAGEWRSREGWLLLMPEAEPGKLGSLEMLKWLVGLHDAFNLYGRPAGYTWNPRDPASLMFAYPVGPQKDNLFLDRELAENVDPREDRGSVVRQRFKEILLERMYGSEGASRLSMVFPSPTGNGSAAPAPASMPPSLPPIQTVAERRSEESQESQHTPQNTAANGGKFQLPPLNFDSSAPASNTPPVRDPPSLSPITERTDSHSQSRASTQDHVHSPPSTSASMRVGHMQSTIEEESVLGKRRVESPAGNASLYNDMGNGQQRSGTTSPRAPAQLAPRFSQDSGAGLGPTQGARAEASSGAASPTHGMRSPPLSPESSISRYSQPEGSMLSSHHTNITHPENVQLPPSNVQTPASEREASLAVSSMHSPMSSVLPRMTTQQQNEQAPLTPTSMASQATFMTSPFSIHDVASLNKDQPPAPPSKSPQRGESWGPQYKHKAHESEYVFNEPGALYYMQEQQRQSEGGAQGPRTRRSENQGWDESDEEEQSVASEHSVLTNPMSVMSAASPSRVAAAQQQQQQQQTRASNVPVSPVARRQNPAGFEVVSGAVGTAALASARSGRSGSLDTSSAYSGGGTSGATGSSSGNNINAMAMENGIAGPRGLGRRPSGARALPRVSGRFVPTDSPSSMPREVDEQSPSSTSPSASPRPYEASKHAQMSAHDDETIDALAALSFLDQHDASGAPETGIHMASQQEQSLTVDTSAPVPPTILEPEDRAPSPTEPRTSKQKYRSSFAPSKQAAERKARSQAQQAAHDEAVHKPGRPNGKQRAKQREGGWDSSEDEEEEEEEEEEEDDEDDDDEVNADDEPPTMSRGGSGAPSIAAPVGRNPMVQQQMRGLSPSNSTSDDPRDPQGQQRSVRTLPQIPQRGRSPAVSDRKFDQHDGYRESSMGRPQSQYPQYPPQFQQQFQQQQQQQQQQQPGAARQNIWSSVLDANRDTGIPQPNSNNVRDTFVQIEAPSETMTKAFTPQGLLSAGMQDKQDRSAKRQEELARESGVSLINVPNKPPPPQVGLLGAITAHERERKREGGMGATITEREREKRMAEERQRRLDDLQRQQLEQQQQLAAQFGGGMGMYGGGLTPQMTGMNPMMGAYGGYPQMMGPQSMYFPPMFNPMMANPQHMYAAQQAAQAYQQAMMAMSTAGSQVGGGDNNGGRSSPNMNAMGPMGGAGSPSPNQMMGGMGYDPRMSMISMGGMMPMVPMGGMPGPMGMQMSGGNNMGATPGMGGMDPRFSMGPGAFDGTGGGLSASAGQNTPAGSGQQSQRVSSYNGSPATSPDPGPPNRNGNTDRSGSRDER